MPHHIGSQRESKINGIRKMVEKHLASQEYIVVYSPTEFSEHAVKFNVFKVKKGEKENEKVA